MESLYLLTYLAMALSQFQGIYYLFCSTHRDARLPHIHIVGSTARCRWLQRERCCQLVLSISPSALVFLEAFLLRSQAPQANPVIDVPERYPVPVHTDCALQNHLHLPHYHLHATGGFGVSLGTRHHFPRRPCRAHTSGIHQRLNAIVVDTTDRAADTINLAPQSLHRTLELSNGLPWLDKNLENWMR